MHLFPSSLAWTKATNGKLAGQAYKWHTKVGYVFKFLIPVHVGAATLHAVRGHKIFARINPLAKKGWDGRKGKAVQYEIATEYRP